MYDYENNFYLSTQSQRLRKIIVQFKLIEKTLYIPGDIVEFGIFKGASFSRLTHYRKLLALENTKKLIGFDVFDTFLTTSFVDISEKKKFTDQAGDKSITKQQMNRVLDNNNCNTNIELVEGDILKTLPEYLNSNKSIKFSFINLDVDLENITYLILEECYFKLSIGGIIMFDDYMFFTGATKLIDDFCYKHKLAIKSFPYTKSPSYIIKEVA
jgi:hypothetical protein